MKKKYALVSDFDGTITGDDFFFYLKENFFDEESLRPWDKYLAGQETLFNALNAMFNQLRIDEKQLKSFIKTIRYDDAFSKTAELCNLKKIPVYIVSAGCDYYINELIGHEIKKYKIKLITNKGVYSKKQGLNMIAFDKTSPYYDEKLGISKKYVVESLKKDGYTVIFAGDGPPDAFPARVSDYVFARKHLLEYCQVEKIPYKNFSTFEDIYNFIKEL